MPICKTTILKLCHGLTALALGAVLAAPLAAAPLDPATGEAFTGTEFGWLMSPGMMAQMASTGEPKALDAIAQLYRQGDPRANFTLQNYIKRYPRDPAIFDLAGTVLLGEGNYNEAVLSFRQAVSLDGRAPWTRAKLGAALLLSGKISEGERELAKVVEQQPDNALALRYLSWLALQRGDLAGAIRHSERSLNAFGLPEGRFNQAHLDLAELYSRADRNWEIVTLLQPVVDATPITGEALEVYQRYLDAAMALGLGDDVRVAMAKLERAAPPENPLRRLMEARQAMIIDHDAPRALALYQDLVATVPELSHQLRPDLARAYGMAGEVDKAVEIFRELADERPAGQDMQVVTEMVAMLLSRGRAELAAAEVTARLAPAPTRADLQYLLAEIYVESGDLTRAAAVADGLAAAHPESAEAQYLLGAIRYQQGDRAAAVADLRRSVELDPARPNVWLTLVGAMHGHDGYAHAGDAGHAEVEAVLVEAVAANPADAMLRTELGLLRLTGGRLDEATADFDAALASVPNYVRALNLGAIARADAGKDLDRAAALNDLALKITPQGPVEHDIRGWIEVRRGALDTGIAALREALAMEPDDETIHYHLGAALAEKGEAEAVEELVVALRGDLYLHNAADARARLAALNPGPTVTVPVHAINAFGVGAQIGTIEIAATPTGLALTPILTGLPTGPNAAHVHEKPDCGPGLVGTEMVAGAAAGPHYGMADHDHDHGDAAAAAQPAAHDHGAHDHGAGTPMAAAAYVHGAPALPRGDLPPFVADQAGVGATPIATDRLTLAEIRGRSLMIHQGPDKEGKSGPKIACAIIR